MLQSAALAVLALPADDHGAVIVLLSVSQGVINAFDTPARQAFVVEMIEDRDDLPNAIALNSSMVNGSAAGRAVDRGRLDRRGRRGVVLRARRASATWR